MRIPVRLLGTGSHVPERLVTNEEIGRRCGVPASWLEQRTGFRERRHAAPDEASSDLGAAAAARALDAAGVAAGELGLVACTTCTPDHAFPSTAALIARRIGARGAAAFDLEAGCAGFVYAIVMAAQQVAAGLCRHALVVGADVMSRVVDPTDRNTAALFGDGAGAAVLGPCPDGSRGIEVVQLGADGEGAELLRLRGGGSRRPEPSARSLVLEMKGPALYRAAVRHAGGALRSVLSGAGLAPADVDLVVPHQSSRRMLSALARASGVPLEKLVINLDRHANTACASLPMALDEAWRAGRVGSDRRIALLGFGAGITWGAALLRT